MRNALGYCCRVLLLSALCISCGTTAAPPESTMMDRAPSTDPDYADIVIPPNIAPLHFRVREPGTQYYVKIHSTHGAPIQAAGRSPTVRMPPRAWRALLTANRGEPLYLDVYVRAGGKWQQFQRITNRIAREEIDPFLIYRRIRPIHNRWSDMSIEQRRLESFDTVTIVHNRSFRHGCMHCHTLLGNDANHMLMHSRTSAGPAMVLIRDGEATSVDSRTPFGGAPIGHSAWHPSGKVIVFTVYKVRQFFHTAQVEVREGMDLEAALGYYLVDSGEIKTSPVLSRKDRLETFPAWSPDGRYLYFCTAPIWWTDHSMVPDRYNEIRYDLVRVPYDLKTDTWGEPQTVISAQQIGKSVAQPRFSPDGRFLLFCLCDHGCFPTFQEDSDLYLMDLQSLPRPAAPDPCSVEERPRNPQYERLACNSSQPESWHCWSSNGRWLAFSSKRGAVLFNRVYFSYVDEQGRAHKPFVLPQKDPAFDDSCMRLYQMPELARNPMPIKGEPLARLLRTPGPARHPVPVTGATPKAPTWQGAGDVTNPH